jgi:hypothetical protein
MKTRVIEISLPSLVAGTKYRGESEERMEAVIHEASSTTPRRGAGRRWAAGGGDVPDVDAAK